MLIEYLSGKTRSFSITDHLSSYVAIIICLNEYIDEVKRFDFQLINHTEFAFINNNKVQTYFNVIKISVLTLKSYDLNKMHQTIHVERTWFSVVQINHWMTTIITEISNDDPEFMLFSLSLFGFFGCWLIRRFA